MVTRDKKSPSVHCCCVFRESWCRYQWASWCCGCSQRKTRRPSDCSVSRVVFRSQWDVLFVSQVNAFNDTPSTYTIKPPKRTDSIAIPVPRSKGKGKVLPHSSPSVGPGADPGVRAVSPQVTWSHPPSDRLSLLSARPAVTFPAEKRHRPSAGTKLYCLVTEAHACEQLAQGCYLEVDRPTFEPATFRIASERSTVKPHRPLFLEVGGYNNL